MNDTRVDGIPQAAQTITESMGRYDELPARVREVFRRAPIDYAVTDDIIEWAARDPDYTRVQLIKQASGHIGIAARETYGPSHPQAARG